MSGRNLKWQSFPHPLDTVPFYGKAHAFHHNDYIFVFLDCHKFPKQLLQFDYSKREWKVLDTSSKSGSIPHHNRFNFKKAQHSNWVFMLGTYHPELYRINLDTLKWEHVGLYEQLDSDVYLMISYNNALYIIAQHYFSEKIYVSKFENLDQKPKWSKVKTLNTPLLKDSCSGVIYQDNLYILGGRGVYEKCLFHKLDLKSLKWTTIDIENRFPGGILDIYGHSAVVLDRYMFVFGGKLTRSSGFDDFKLFLEDEITEVSNMLYRYDFERNKWCILEAKNAPSPRIFHSSVVVDGKLYVFGGEEPLPDCAVVLLQTFEEELLNHLNSNVLIDVNFELS